ncbi:MAG: hypothetical protein L0956_02295 [Candidatus Mariimomonas ferrooxydans]
MKTISVISTLFLTLFFSISDASPKDTKSSEQKPHIGTVTFTQTTGNYAYIKLDEHGKEVWLATQPLNVSVGDKVEYMGGYAMKNFHSKGMEKTFDSIFFTDRIMILNKDSLKDTQPVPADEYHKDLSQAKKAVSKPDSSEIVKADNGKTIDEIFSEIEQLKDKEVIVRGRVIKVSKNILGKNWITLQDGTGVSPDDTLIATTSETVNTDDILTVRGIVKTNVNLGSGYKYRVLLEDAKFTK